MKRLACRVLGHNLVTVSRDIAHPTLFYRDDYGTHQACRRCRHVIRQASAR